MKRFVIALFALLCSAVAAQAQSGCPTIVFGAVLTAAQWNACFASKVDVLPGSGYVPLSGGTMTGQLIVNLNGGSIPTAATGTGVQLVGSNATVVRFEADSFGAIAAFTARRANGTDAAPTALLSGDQIGAFNFHGYYVTGGPAYSSVQANVAGYATQNWTSTALGTKVVIRTTPNSTTTLTDALTIGQDGSATVAGKLFASNGTVGAPSISFTSDPTTGMYRIGASNPGIAAGGVLRFSIGAGLQLFNNGADTNIVMANFANYNFLSLNGDTGGSASVGILGGKTADANMFYYVASGGAHQFRVISSNVATMDATKTAILPTTASTSKTTGSLTNAGGFGNAGAIFTDTLSVITMASAATTSAVCYNTGTGLLTYNSTVGTCTVSTLDAKDLTDPLAPKEGFDIVMAMEPWRYTLKKGLPTYKTGEQIGFVAEYARAREPRLVAVGQDGKAEGFLYEQYTAALTAAIKFMYTELKADNDNLHRELERLKVAR